MDTNQVCAIVLAAGKGTRMKSARAKALCQVLFKPMISWVLDSVQAADIPAVCVVVSDEADELRAVLPAGAATAVQRERKGTGHAVMMAEDYIKENGFADVLVLYGDAPFAAAADIRASLAAHRASGASVTVLTAHVDDPARYGRIVRQDGALQAIVEYNDADEETRQITEINSGIYWFRADFLAEALASIAPANAQGEYYLTDTVAYAIANGHTAQACLVNARSVLGANTRQDLAELNRLARADILDRHMTNGVDIPIDDGIMIGPDVTIGPDTVILPGTIIKGKTAIGAGCEIGPNSYLENAVIGDDCRILSSYIDSSTLDTGVKIGPMSNVRPGSHLHDGVKIGDFVEIKNSEIGAGTSMSHLTYVGDSDVGRGCNFGCGVVTTNYDGTNKYRTTVGDDVFIGCNTILVAPVKLGNRAYSAAGTTVTEDVPEDALVIGRARQTVKKDWSKKTGKYKGK